MRKWKETKAKRAWQRARGKLKALTRSNSAERYAIEDAANVASAQAEQKRRAAPRGMTVSTKKVRRPPTPPEVPEINLSRPSTAGSTTSHGSARSRKSAKSVGSAVSRATSGMLSVFGFGKKKEPVLTKKARRRQKEREWAAKLGPGEEMMPTMPRTRKTGLTPRKNRPRRSTVGSRTAHRLHAHKQYRRNGAAAGSALPSTAHQR